MTPEAFVTRLEAIVQQRSDRDDHGLLLRTEASHEHRVRNFKGFDALSLASQSFFFGTIELMNGHIRPKVTAPLSQQYPLFLERLSHYFRTLRAAEILGRQGYPLHGYTLLRNLYDSVVLSSAAAQGKTDFLRLEGLVDDTFDPQTFRKKRRQEESAIRATMTGKDSGLSPETMTELARWDTLFDDETHGAVLTRSFSMDWLKGSAPLPVLPTYNETQYALFMNRHCEIGWMVHRLLPLLQPPQIPFPPGWKSTWNDLDDSYHTASEALATQLNRKIGTAIIELVQTKFPFDADSTFWT